MKKVILLLFVSVFYTSNVSGQSANQKVDSLNTYFNDYSDALRGYRLAVIGETTLTTTQKYDLYIKKKEELREKFKQERQNEYLSLNGIEIGVSHSCTKGSSGGTKDCLTKYVYAPEGFKKVTGSYRTTGQGNFAELTNGASVHLQKSGKGRIEGAVYIKIEIDQKWLDLQLIRESRKLIGDIVANHRKQYPNEGPYW